MVDAGIKKVIIKNDELPPVQFTTVYNNSLLRDEVENLYYDFRYRVISEDRNRYSYWAPIIRYIMPDITTPFPYTATNRFSVSKPSGTDVINAVWSFPGEGDNPSDFERIYAKTTDFDVWVRWNNNNTTDLNDLGWQPWEFQSTISSNNFSILKKDSNVKRVEIAVQVPTTIKVRDYYNNKLTLFRGLSGTI
jgi:hypothetical protein